MKRKALLGISLLLALRPAPAKVQAEVRHQMWILDQEEREKFTSPPEVYQDEAGDLYDLRDWELTRVPRKTEWKEIEQEVIYEQVEAAEQIPQSIPYREMAEGLEVKGELAEASREVVGEEWSDDFEVLLTFHSYGAQTYVLENLSMTVLEDFPPAEEYEEQLLGILGLPLADYEITEMEWRGEAYSDESGELCRKAAAMGRKRLRDYRVVYRGELLRPEPVSYKLKTIYEKRQGSQAVRTEETKTAAPSESAQKGNFWSWIHTGAAVSITLGLMGIALGLFILGLSGRRKHKEDGS